MRTARRWERRTLGCSLAHSVVPVLVRTGLAPHTHAQAHAHQQPKKRKEDEAIQHAPSPCADYVVLWQELSDDGGASERTSSSTRLSDQVRLLTARLNWGRGLSVCLARTQSAQTRTVRQGGDALNASTEVQRRIEEKGTEPHQQ